MAIVQEALNGAKKDTKRIMLQSKEKAVLLEVFKKLSLHYGPQRWWPGETPFEVAVGAILVQHTSWRSAERAVGALKEQRLLEVSALNEAPAKEICGTIAVAGLVGQKVGRLKRFARLLSKQFQSDLIRLLKYRKARLLLMSVKGIGEETADSILLYAGERLTVPIGSYTRRILMRIGFPKRGYEKWRSLVLNAVPSDVVTLKEFHAVFVAHGRALCRIRPLCQKCPVLEVCASGKARQHG